MDFKDALKNIRNEDTESITLLTKTNVMYVMVMKFKKISPD